MKPIIFVFLLILAGCGGGSTVHAAAPNSPSPQTATPTPTPTPSPTPTPTPITATLPTGTLTSIDVGTGNQTITLEPGDYSCPASIPSGTRIIGHGSIVPAEMLGNDFAPMSATLATAVRIFCDTNVILTSVSGVEISGVIFYFENIGGLVIDSSIGNKFEIGIADSPLAINLEATTGNTMSNFFPRLVIYNVSKGILWQGLNNYVVTWNDFGHVEMVRVHDYGIDVAQFADTNSVDHLMVRMYQGASGVIFNDKAVLGDVDASGNVFKFVGCDIDFATPGYCVDFRGYTVGNYVVQGFSIMTDANKIHFQNAFSQTANTVIKLQEGPKIP
jgi:hypothetical protein